MKKSADIALYENSPVGDLTLLAEGEYLKGVLFGACYAKDLYQDTPFLLQVKKELDEYFAKERERFTIALEFSGTSFQEQVFQKLYLIDYGETKSYFDIAKDLGNVKAVRAVGQALKKNPLPIFLPCHRVLTKDGYLGGYTGGIAKKITLLELEGASFKK